MKMRDTITIGTLVMAALSSVGVSEALSQWPGESIAHWSGTANDTIAWHRGFVEGYTHSPSVKQGDSVHFKVSTLAAFVPPCSTTSVQCTMTIYRMTSRSRLGTGDALIASGILFPAQFYPLNDSANQPICPGDRTRFPYEYRRGCSWPTAISVVVQPEWPSGLYYA
jgi:hypothetical protein